MIFGFANTKGAEINLHVNSPTLRAAKLTGLTVFYAESRIILRNNRRSQQQHRCLRTTVYEQHQATAAGKTWQTAKPGPGRRRRSISSTPR